MGFSNYLEDKVLDHVFKGSSFAQPSSLFIALFTADPGEEGSLGEVAAGGYARVECANWAQAANGSKATAQVVTFPQATDAWGTITHFGIFDAATGGNFILGGAFTTSKAIGSGDTVELASGTLVVTLD